MDSFSKNEINYIIQQSNDTTKWREYLTIYNKPSRFKRQPKLSRKENISVKKFWNDIYDETKIIAPKCLKKNPLIGNKYQIDLDILPKISKNLKKNK